MSATRQYLTPSWDGIYELLLEIAMKIRQTGFKPDLIVGVSRGGWAPARILSDLLENTHTANMKIEFYVGLGKTAKTPIVTQPISENIEGKKVLIVDDVSDSGASLKVAQSHMLDRKAAAAKTVTIYYKPHSKFKPDFHGGETGDWIIFPWERLEATKLMISEAQAEGRSLESVRETLERCGFDKKTIESLFQLAIGGS
jgi:hypoxanthine phosphoribosyltransferase